MKIKYTGPRPSITHHGIVLEGKEDKYVYLVIGEQILKAIDKNFSEHKSYSYDISTKKSSDEEILKTIMAYEPNLEQHIMIEKENYEKKLDDEIEQARNKENLSELEQDVLVNNLKIMKEYRIQRAVNKIYYMHNIHEIAQIIKREQIAEIDTPFYQKYLHVLRTIQGELAKENSSIKTDLKIEKNSDNLMVAKLLISNF